MVVVTAALRLGGDWLDHRHDRSVPHSRPVLFLDMLPTTARVEAVERSRLEDAFLTLNPDFGVVPEHDHAGQHRLAYDREQAITLGIRRVVELRAENTGPAHRRYDVIRQRVDDARCRATLRHPNRPPPSRLVAREGLER